MRGTQFWVRRMEENGELFVHSGISEMGVENWIVVTKGEEGGGEQTHSQSGTKRYTRASYTVSLLPLWPLHGLLCSPTAVAMILLKCQSASITP